MVWALCKKKNREKDSDDITNYNKLASRNALQYVKNLDWKFGEGVSKKL